MVGRRPTIRYFANPMDDYKSVHESRFYPNTANMLYLHAHSGSSPHLPSRSSGFDIDIYQDTSCPVNKVSLTIDWGSSLAKMVTRHRMAALAWIIGWAALLTSRSVSLMERTGESDESRKWADYRLIPFSSREHRIFSISCRLPGHR